MNLPQAVEVVQSSELGQQVWETAVLLVRVYQVHIDSLPLSIYKEESALISFATFLATLLGWQLHLRILMS